MFNKKSIQISKELFEDLELYIKDTNHKSVSGFVEEYLENNIRSVLEEKKIEDRLKGLGYIE